MTPPEKLVLYSSIDTISTCSLLKKASNLTFWTKLKGIQGDKYTIVSTSISVFSFFIISLVLSIFSSSRVSSSITLITFCPLKNGKLWLAIFFAQSISSCYGKTKYTLFQAKVNFEVIISLVFLCENTEMTSKLLSNPPSFKY